jgi:hypothetical protein
VTPTTLFPRWNGGIFIDDVVEAIRLTLDGKLKHDRADRVFIVDNFGLKAASPNNSKTTNILHRGNRAEGLAHYALMKFTANATAMSTVYPFFTSAMARGGFAYIANHADSQFCTYTPFENDSGKTISNASVPIFTLSSPVNCLSAFPCPTYQTIIHSQNSWENLLPSYQSMYPWYSKKPLAVWRGTPTGPRKLEKNSRLKLCALSQQRPDLLDAKIVKTMDGSTHGVYNESIYVGSRMKMEDFQLYKAILDIDGNSWSSRFGALLCFSSVVIKVEPANVDYFHPTLVPWTHYIPVSSDLSDLYDAVEYAISKDHEEEVLQIISRANDWCLQHLKIDVLADDLLRIWDVYTKHLYQADFGWSSKWSEHRAAILKEYQFVAH